MKYGLYEISKNIRYKNLMTHGVYKGMTLEFENGLFISSLNLIKSFDRIVDAFKDLKNYEAIISTYSDCVGTIYNIKEYGIINRDTLDVLAFSEFPYKIKDGEIIC